MKSTSDLNLHTFDGLYRVLNAPVRQWQAIAWSLVFALLFGGPFALAGGFTAGPPSFSSISGTLSSAQMPDAYTPTDGTMNVTGDISASAKIHASAGGNPYVDIGQGVSSTTGVVTGLSISGQVAFWRANDGSATVTGNKRVDLQPLATYGVELVTSGSKVTCDSGNSGSFFYENTASDSTAAILYLCGEKADNTFAWGTVTVTYP